MDERCHFGRYAIVVVLLSIVGCGGDKAGIQADGDPGSRAPGVAVDPGALRPAGSELISGVDVRPGSSLVGTTFPVVEDLDATSTDDRPVNAGWQALLVVEGDPVEVWDRYAAALGISKEASAVNRCVVARIDQLDERGSESPTSDPSAPRAPVPAERFITEDRLDGENRISCEAWIDGTAMTMVVGSPRCTSDWTTLCAAPATSHLVLRVRTAGGRNSVVDSDQVGTADLRFQRGVQEATATFEKGEGPEPDQHVEPAPIPDGEPVSPHLDDTSTGSRLPLEGEPFDDSLDDYLTFSEGGSTAVAHVPKGGRSLVAPAMLGGCNSGLVAVLSVPGSVAEAVALFDDADDGDESVGVVEGTDDDGRAWAGARILSTGGYGLDVTAVADGNDISTVFLIECGD